jgi:hypothetical protein
MVSTFGFKFQGFRFGGPAPIGDGDARPTGEARLQKRNNIKRVKDLCLSQSQKFRQKSLTRLMFSLLPKPGPDVQAKVLRTFNVVLGPAPIGDGDARPTGEARLQRRNTIKRFKDFCLKAQARISGLVLYVPCSLDTWR